jgi:penicillin amidase
VPHIYAASDRDAVIALGYVVAQDRLFQLDFLPRVASGRLAEALGPQAVSSDQFLRQTGMEWGAQKNLERVRAADGIELRALQWYGMGVNTYLDQRTAVDLPLEFRLLDYEPDRFTPIQGLRLLQYMTFDLTYNTDTPGYRRLRRQLGEKAYETLYPSHPPGLFEPIIPERQRQTSAARGGRAAGTSANEPQTDEMSARAALQKRRDGLKGVEAATGLRPNPRNGSNNWAVMADRSATDGPLLAGDMHLSLSLPSIWYEAHLVTPTMNAHGLTIPGAPVLIQAFNQHVGWALTNTGADQIDHYALELDSSGTRYWFEGAWRALRREVDTIHVNGGSPVLDTISYAHFGPVHRGAAPGGEGTAIAEQWVGHDTSRTLRALWKMNRADHARAVQRALRDWDTPMQNVLYAGVDDTIAIRATGLLPVRRGGHGRGLLDGTTDRFDWTGRVPFDELPHAQNPERGFLASSNQKPTGPDYPHYLGHDWPDGYRSLRIDSLLEGKRRHTISDFQQYQADVEVQQRHVFVPPLRSVTDLSSRAEQLRGMLLDWEGEATPDHSAPLVLDTFLEVLRRRRWDEPIFAEGPDPSDAVLHRLLKSRPEARWFDIQDTRTRETAKEVFRDALETTVDSMTSRYGWRPDAWRWGAHHQLVLRHLTQTDALRSLWRGPFEYPGFEATLSPAAGRTVTHSASQRVVVDFGGEVPTGKGVVPGGQRGRPLDPYFYDTQIPSYLNFGYFDLRSPASPAGFDTTARQATQVLRPQD